MDKFHGLASIFGIRLIIFRVPMVPLPKRGVVVAGRDHDGSKCTTDLSKKPCFKYHEFGHISTNCRGDAKSWQGSGKPIHGRKFNARVLLHPPVQE